MDGAPSSLQAAGMLDPNKPSRGAHREFKRVRAGISDQQRRREMALARQKEARRNLQAHARRLALDATAGTGAPDVQVVPLSAIADGASAPLTSHEEKENILAEGGIASGSNSASEVAISELDTQTGSWVRIDKEGRRVVESRQGHTCEGEGSTASLVGGREEDADMACDQSEAEEAARPSYGKALFGRESGSEARSAQEWYAQQLMMPEWMIDIPPRLHTEWLVLPRPEGRRCLVISSNGTTVSRLRNGRILHRFPSVLPNGARTQGIAAAANVYCILDCVFHEPNSTYFILDVMDWRGYTLYDCTTDFRFFWLHSKIHETEGLHTVSHFHRYRFLRVPVYDCSRTGLEAAYRGPTEFQRDGLLLYNKHAHYTLGLTPLVLAWKDSSCSQYLLDTDASGVVPHKQQIVLEYRIDGTVATSDTPPLVFGTLPPTFCSSNSKYLKQGLLLKFVIGEGGINMKDGQLISADIRYEGPANQRRGAADSFSKILFQYSARRDPLTFSSILESLRLGAPDGDSSMSTSDVTHSAHEVTMC